MASQSLTQIPRQQSAALTSMDHDLPYVPPIAMVGLQPTIRQDIAPSAVFLALYLASAVGHQIVFQRNRRRKHKFYLSLAMFGFSMARIVTLALRIAWACKPDNVSLTIAATIFVNVGIVVVYVVLLLLSLRTFRALHPRLGWSAWLRRGIRASYIGLGIAIVLVVIFTVISYYTLDKALQTGAKWVQRGSILYMLAFNLTSLALFLLCLVLPKSHVAESFGTGSMRSKLVILATALFFTLFIAGFRLGTSWSDARPLSDPAWYDARAGFYIIELFFEIVVTYLLLFTRFDKRFWVPDGSSKPGDYSRGVPNDEARSQEPMRDAHSSGSEDSRKTDADS